MEQSKKGLITFFLVLIGYILLGMLGIFGDVVTALFPILALPFTLYCMNNKVTTRMHIVFHLIAGGGVSILMGSPYCLLIYGVAVIAPTYITLFLYKNEQSTPNIIMYLGIGLSVIVFVFFTLMKQVGIDFEVYFASLMDETKQILLATMDTTIKANELAGTSAAQIQQLSTQMRQMIEISIDTMKLFYPAIVISQLMICCSISIVVINAIMRRKNKMFPSNRDILEFRVSKVAVVLLMLCMFLPEQSASGQDAWIIIGLNLMCFLMNLLQIAGVLGLIGLLRRTSLGKMVKGVGYVLIVALLIFSPYIAMFFGCLDAIFNYRKVKIVV